MLPTANEWCLFCWIPLKILWKRNSICSNLIQRTNHCSERIFKTIQSLNDKKCPVFWFLCAAKCRDDKQAMPLKCCEKSKSHSSFANTKIWWEKNFAQIGNRENKARLPSLMDASMLLKIAHSYWAYRRTCHNHRHPHRRSFASQICSRKLD